MSIDRYLQAIQQSDDLEDQYDIVLEASQVSPVSGQGSAEESVELDNFLDTVQQWIGNAVAWGSYVHYNSERRILQAKINEWALVLKRHGRDEVQTTLKPASNDAGVPLLDEFGKEIDCPYPGLIAYNASDVLIGREEEVVEYCAHLEQHDFLSVVGGSGTGKSSIVLSGVLPALRSQRNSDLFIFPVMTPGADPIQSFVEVLEEVPIKESLVWKLALIELLQCDLKSEEFNEKLAEHLGVMASRKAWVLYIDQFEELHSLCPDRKQRQRFADLLIALGQAGNKVITTTRTDHIHLFEDRLKDLYDIMRNSAKFLGPLSFEQLKRVVEIPAQRVGLRFVPPLLVTDKLIVPAQRSDNPLPLLQFALRKLWDNRPRQNGDGPRLDIINEYSFKELPDVENALGYSAKKLYGELSDDHRRGICKRAVLELVVASDIQEPLRRRRTESELVSTLVAVSSAISESESERIDIVNGIVQSWVTAGLWVRTGSGPTAQIEIAHEALFRSWQDFRTWFADHKEDLKLIATLEREENDWRTNIEKGDVESFLKLQGGSLNRAETLINEHWLNQRLIAYVRACRENQSHKEKNDAERKRAIKSEEELKKTRNYTLLGSIAFLAIASLISVSKFNAVESSNAEVASKLLQLQSRLSPFEFGELLGSISDKDNNFTDQADKFLRTVPDVVELGSDDLIHFSTDGATMVRYSKPPTDKDSAQIGKLSAYTLRPSPNADLGSRKWIDIAYSQIDSSDESISAGDKLVKSLTSSVGQNGKITFVNVFERSNDNEATSILISLVRRSLVLKEGEDPLSHGYVHKIKPAVVGDITFDTEGERVLVVSKTYKQDAPPEVSLLEFGFSDEEFPEWQVYLDTTSEKPAVDCALQDNIYTAALLDTHPCPAVITNTNYFYCPGKESGYIARDGPAVVSQVISGKEGTLLLKDDNALYAWSCPETDDNGSISQISPSLTFLATGKDIESTILKRDDQLYIVAVVDKRSSCWASGKHGWSEFACLPGVPAEHIVLPPGIDRLAFIPEAGKINSRILWEVPFNGGAAGVNEHTTVEELPRVDILATSNSAIARYTSSKKYEQTVAFEKVGNTQSSRKPVSQELITFLIPEDKESPARNLEKIQSKLQDIKPHRIALSPDGKSLAIAERKPDSSIQIKTYNTPSVSNTELSFKDVIHVVPKRDQEGSDIELVLSNGVGNSERLFYRIANTIVGHEYDGKNWVEVETSMDTPPLKAISCLAISENGKYLVATWNTGGKIFNLDDDAEKIDNVEDDEIEWDVSSCAVSDSGMAVIGNNRGGLQMTNDTDLKFEKIEPGILLPGAIKKIQTIQGQDDGEFALVLSTFQNRGCVLENMGGHTISLWRIGSDSPQGEIARGCVPNTRIQNIGFHPDFTGEVDSGDVNVSYWSDIELRQHTLLRDLKLRDGIRNVNNEYSLSDYGFDIKSGRVVVKQSTDK